MNMEKSLDIIKGKLLMIDKMLKQDQEEGHGSAYEMQTEDFEAIKTLLTAYEKEKGTNKQIKCKLDEKNIPIETLLAEFERLEDLEDDLTTVYLNGVYDGEKKVEDKIKAKIEELEKLDFGTDLVSQFTANLTTITILQSLLDKE